MLPLADLPTIVEHYAPLYESLFTKAGYQHFKRFIAGLLVSENKTVQAINRLFLPTETQKPRDQSNLNRFLHKSPFDRTLFHKTRLSMLGNQVATALKPKGILSVDDTLLTHVGKKIEGIYVIWDHVEHRYVRAHNLLTLHYSDDQTDYPIDYQFWKAPDVAAIEAALDTEGIYINPEKRANKEALGKKWRHYLLQRYGTYQYKKPVLQETYQTKLHLGLEMFKGFCEEYPNLRLPFSFDSWFTQPDFCRQVAELDRIYVGALKTSKQVQLAGNRLLTVSEFAEQLKEEHLSSNKPVFEKTSIPYKGKREVYYTYCQTHRIKSYGKQRLLISYNQEDLGDTPKFYICNQHNWMAYGICRIARHRWPVEVFHQEGKAEGLGKYQLRNAKGIDSHVAFVVLVYSMLQSAKHDVELLSKLRAQLTPQLDGSSAYWRRLTQAESFAILVEWIFLMIQKGQSLEQVLQPLMQTIAYT